ncbi:MAG: hypothetical protein EPN39_13585, partial [Chitinophagaceae bacterium]
MKWRFILLLLVLLTTFQASEAQSISSPARQVDSVTNKVRQRGDELQQIPSRYLTKVSSKADLFNRRITKRTEKALHRLQKQEEKINSKLSKIDLPTGQAGSVAAKGLALGNSIDSISHLQELVRNKVTKITSRLPGGKYIPYLDSLQTSLNFLNKYQSDLSKAGGIEKDLSGSLSTLRQAQGDLMKAQGDMQQLEGKLNQVQDIQQYIQQRQQLLTQALSKYGSLFSKNIGSISKEAYYYKATIENYKELWQH